MLIKHCSYVHKFWTYKQYSLYNEENGGRLFMSLEDLRKRVHGEIFDYQMLMFCLREYKKPRDKATLFLKEGLIIKIKKGLYIFGTLFRRRPISQELLANLIYGPSYISLEYALSKYGLIPERVVNVTSISLNRSKTFKTPITTFIYSSRPAIVYPIGLHQIEIPQEGSYLIATREKALIDLLSRTKEITEVQDMKDYLYENMRMEKTDLKKLNQKLLAEILKAYKMSDILIRAIYD